MTFGTCTRLQRDFPVNASIAIAMVAFSFPSIAHASAGSSSPEEAILVALQIKTTPEGLRAYLIEMSNSNPRSKEVYRLIAELGSASFANREAATAHLRALPVPPLQAIREACKADDAEVRERARQILAELERRGPVAPRLFAALLLIRDREVTGTAEAILRALPLCTSPVLRRAAEQAMAASVRPTDRPLLEKVSAKDDEATKELVHIGLAVLDNKTPKSWALVTWIDFFDELLVRGQSDGERIELLKGVPVSVIKHFQQTTRTANTIDAVANRHATSPWLYPVAGKNELPRPFVEARRKHYPIWGSWRQRWNQWRTLDENGRILQGAAAPEPHFESQVDFLVVPLRTAMTE
jgi:hypothetical protein